MGKLLDRLTTELVGIIGEEVEDDEFAEALEVEVLFGEATAMGATSYDVPAPSFNNLYRAMETAAGKKAEKKGFIDVDLIGDLKQWRSGAEQELSQMLGDMLWMRSKVYIKDQRDFFKAIGSSPARLGQMIKDAILREWNSLGNIGLERDEPEAQAWLSAVRMGERARVTIRPVKGKGASGWAVEMKPPARTILRALDLSESFAYLAKTALNESVVTEGELSEQRFAPKTIVELFSKASGQAIDPKSGRALGKAFIKALRSTMARTINFDNYKPGEVDVTDEKEEMIGGEAAIETSRSRDPQDSDPAYVNFEGSVMMPTEVELWNNPSLGIPLAVHEMKPMLVKLMGQEGFIATQQNLARVMLANPKARKLLQAAVTEYVKTMGVEASKFSDDLTKHAIDSKDGPIMFVGGDMKWQMAPKTVKVKVLKGAKAARGGQQGGDIQVEVTARYRVSGESAEYHFDVDEDEIRAQWQRDYDDWIVGQYGR